MPLRRRPRLTASVLGTSAGLLVLSSPALTQEQGGVLMTFGLSQTFDFNDNADMDVTSVGTTSRAVTGLSFGILSRTRSTSIGADASISLQVVDEPDQSGTEFEIGDTAIGLDFSHTTRSSTLTFGATYLRQDLEFLDPLADLEDLEDVENGIIDIEDLTRTGDRDTTSMSASFSLGDDRPFGAVFSASYRDVDFSEPANNGSFEDNTRSTIGVDMRFDIDRALSANVDIGYSRFDEEGSEIRETTSLETGFSLARPNGDIGAFIDLADTTDGTRSGLGLSRSLDLPRGALSGRFGVTRAASSDVFFTGGLRYSHELNNGQISLGLSQSLSSTTSDSETLNTLGSLGISHRLSPLTSANLNMSFAQRQETLSGDTTDVASVSLGLSTSLTEDWSLNASVRHEFRQESDSTERRANVISFGISRSLDIRY